MSKLGLESEPMSALQDGILALARHLRRSVSKGGETWTEVMALRMIGQGGGQLTPKDIARELGIHTTNLGSILRALEKRGLLRRRADLIDKRKVRVSLTESGTRSVNEARLKSDRWLFDVMARHLSKHEQLHLLLAGQLMCRLTRAANDLNDNKDEYG
jgi:DNA-binding MarR family transcriptional regulator